jgi:hypothetical protein
VEKTMPTNQANRQSLKSGQTIAVTTVRRSFSPRYGEFVIVTDAKGIEWYSFSQPVMSAFLGSGTHAPLELPVTVEIIAETSKAGRTYLNVSKVLE